MDFVFLKFSTFLNNNDSLYLVFLVSLIIKQFCYLIISIPTKPCKNNLFYYKYLAPQSI